MSESNIAQYQGVYNGKLLYTCPVCHMYTHREADDRCTHCKSALRFPPNTNDLASYSERNKTDNNT